MAFGFDQDDDDSRNNRSYGSWYHSPTTDAINLAIDEPAIGLILGGILIGGGLLASLAASAVGLPFIASIGGTAGGLGVVMCGGALIADVCNGIKAGVEFIAEKIHDHRTKAGSKKSADDGAPHLSQEAEPSSVSALRSGALKKTFAGTAGVTQKSPPAHHPRRFPSASEMARHAASA